MHTDFDDNSKKRAEKRTVHTAWELKKYSPNIVALSEIRLSAEGQVGNLVLDFLSIIH